MCPVELATVVANALPRLLAKPSEKLRQAAAYLSHLHVEVAVAHPLHIVLHSTPAPELVDVQALRFDPCRAGKLLVEDKGLLVLAQLGHPLPRLDLANVGSRRSSELIAIGVAGKGRHHEPLGRSASSFMWSSAVAASMAFRASIFGTRIISAICPVAVRPIITFITARGGGP